MKKSTLDLYDRVLKKIEVNSILDLQDHDTVILRINTLSSDSYKLMAYRAINYILKEYNQIVDDANSDFKEINAIYNKEYKKLVQLQNIKCNEIVLPMTLPELLSIEINEPNELRKLVESFTIYMNTHYPLRLDYYNVALLSGDNAGKPPEIDKSNYGHSPTTNYMTYSKSVLTFYLNDFKNVRSFGPQVITYSDPVICSYLTYLSNHFGHLPKVLLYRYDKPTKTLQPFSSRAMYGGYLQDLLKKHTGFDISMNTIRKIHESALIQSPEYSKMSFDEKKNRHAKLLHGFNTANACYNVLK
jgi:hypothetical protein